ncbi:MAG: response regulator with CheY-like receiver domain and winged-helix DNA-binding domain [Actinomycetia bacterium]|jgi:two-component system phosphate regulon response regulator PhoB|nr:response regulator with CheY-like receiver domain and winged-helix DNA-binding domain [Actinomycetes bacterium]
MTGILAIEDDWTVRTVLEHTLKSAGYDVDLVPGISDARQLLAEGRYDLVLLDLNLPDGNGLDLLRDIRKDLGTGVPVLVLSGLRQEEVVVRGLELGADDFVTKPFSPPELLARVGRCLGQRTGR